MGALVPPDDLPEAPQAPQLVPADDLPDPAAPPVKTLSGWDKTVNMIGRGAWALPGLVGLDYERANEIAGQIPLLRAAGGAPREETLKISRQVDAENPITSGLVRGVAAAPGEALAWMAAPEVKGPQLIAQGGRALSPVLAKVAPYVERALAYGPRTGLLTGASEYGSTAHKDPLERAAGAGTAAATGTVLGGGMAAALPNPAVLAPGRPTFDPAEAERAAAQAQANATVASRAASGADAAAQGGDAAVRNATEISIQPSRPTLLSRALREPEPTPDARYLAERGVRLTKGLNDPNSSFGAMEIASQSKGVTGPLIRNQRTRALEDAMDLAFEEARPPGAAKIGKAGDINEKYSRLKGQWDEAYGAIRAKDELIQPSILEGDFGVPLKTAVDQIIDDATDPVAAVWDDASRVQARRFLDNQFTRLKAGAKDEAGRVPLGDMLRTLSDVRKASRAALQGEKYDLHQILARAEDAFEQAIESQASPETSAQLKALNAKYRDFKTVEDAVVRAKDAPGGISPAQLSMSVKATEPMRSRYAAGGGGELRNLSKAVRTVFDETGMPPTGARIGSIAPPWLHDMTFGPTIYLRNASSASAQGGRAGARALSASKAAAKAQGRADAAATSPVDPNLLAEFFAGYPLEKTSPSALALSAAMQRRLGLRLPPATAEDDR
jgi:hypothetical protein